MAAKVASAFIELSVKTGTAMREITDAIQQLDKIADRSGKAAGDALDKSLSKGARSAGQSLGTEITKAAEKAGADAGDALAEGMTKGATEAGEKVVDELSKATKKAGEDAGKQIGDGLSKGVSQATRGAGKQMGGELSRAARRAGEDAGTELSDGLSKGADEAGAKVGEKVTAAAKQAANDVARVVIEPTVTPRVDTKAATKDAQSVGDILREQVGTALGDATKDTTGVGGAGKRVGQSINDAIKEHVGSDLGIGTAIGDKAQEVIDGILGGTLAAKSRAFNMKAVPEKLGPAGASIAMVPQVEGWMKNAPVLGEFTQDHGLLPDSDNWNWLKAPFRSFAGDIKHPSRLWKDNQYDKNGNFIGDDDGGTDQDIHWGFRHKDRTPVTPTMPKPTSADVLYDGVFGYNASGSRPERSSMDRLYDSVFGAGESSKVGTSAGQVAVTTPAATVAAGTVNLAGEMPALSVMVPPSMTAGFGSSSTKMSDPVGIEHVAAGTSPGKASPAESSLYGAGANSLYLGKHSGGGVAGVDPNGRLYGPGTGTSDSILGVDPGGMPTALVSRGEGIVTNDAMQNGAGPIVSALNAGTPPDQLAITAPPAGFAERTQGYIPAGAGASGQAGTSFASGLYQMGAQAINGLIDQAAGAAAGAAGVMSFGAGGGAAGAAIGIGTQAAKRGVEYGAQMAGIGTDALAEILMPFGVPRIWQTDPTGFMPQIGIKPAAVTTGEKAQTPGANPSGPVQPGQLAGAQPVGAPVQKAQPQGVPSAPTPISASDDPVPTPAAVKAPTAPITPNPAPAVDPPAPQSGPMAAQPDPDNDIYPDMANILPFAKGGIVGVYDDGGWLPAGGIAINQSKRPEPILNDQQWASLNAAISRPVAPPDPAAIGGGGPDFSVNLNGDVHVKDVDALMNEIDSRSRLQMMRYASRP